MAPKRLRHVVLGITASIGFSLSAIATRFVYRWEVSRQQSQFQQQIETLTIALQRSLNRYTTVLTFLGDHYGVNQDLVQPTLRPGCDGHDF
jgi:C4-dicarboxylate-specific signal transduction histidine kinase